MYLFIEIAPGWSRGSGKGCKTGERDTARTYEDSSGRGSQRRRVEGGLLQGTRTWATRVLGGARYGAVHQSEFAIEIAADVLQRC